MRRCDELAECTEEPGRITRRFMTEAMRSAQHRLGGWMRDAGLSVTRDHAGNLIGRRDPGAGDQRLLVGSHIDTVPGAGRYDGVLGVLIGVAVAESLGSQPLPIGLDVLAFSEEEGVRFSKPYLGSSAVAGCFAPEWLDRRDDKDGSLRDALRTFGCDPARLEDAAYDPEQVIGYVEPHLEQGPVLERADSPVGVVSGIVGQSRLRIEFLGESGHAGTTPMAGRRDALLTASRFVVAVRDTAESCEGLHATAGRMEITPNAPNVIPERVELSLDVRHPCDTDRNTAVTRLVGAGQSLAEADGCRFRVLENTAQPAVRVDRAITDRLAESITRCGGEPLRLSSGAGHDAVVMAKRFPSAMLFVRHPGGVSHHPDERVEEADVAVAIRVLRDLVVRVAADAAGVQPAEASR